MIMINNQYFFIQQIVMRSANVAIIQNAEVDLGT